MKPRRGCARAAAAGKPDDAAGKVDSMTARDGPRHARTVGGFDAVDTVQRVAVRMLGTRWPTEKHALLEVTAVVVVSSSWPIRLRMTIAADQWPGPRVFEVELTTQHTLAGTTPAANAEAMSEDVLILVERHLESGSAERLTELT
jgi:hypothetical protein